MKISRSEQDELRKLLEEWEADAATGGMTSERVSRTMVALLRALTNEKRGEPDGN